MADVSLTDAHEHAHDHHLPAIAFGWNIQELKALGLALAVLLVWIGSVAVFGFPGLIVPALFLVLATFVVLIVISQG